MISKMTVQASEKLNKGFLITVLTLMLILPALSSAVNLFLGGSCAPSVCGTVVKWFIF